MPVRPLRILTPLLALAFASCGSSGSAVDPVAQAAKATSQAGGAQMTFTADLGIGGVSMSGHGYFNDRTGEGDLSMQLVGAATGPVQMTELMKSSTVYIRSNLLQGRLPHGAHWMKLDLGRYEQSLGVGLGQLSGGQADPAQYLQYLKAMGGSAEAVGHEAVRGVQTTRYRGAIDLERAAERLPSPDRAKLRAAMAKAIAQIGTKSFPLEVWIDAHHLVRRMTMRIPLPAATGTHGLTISMELFAFGPTPTVNPPSGGEVFDGTGAALSRLG